MQNSPNYNYNLPEYSDSADIAVLNANFSSIDANEYRIEGKLNALGNDIALPYDNTATYSVGDYTIYNNALYRCITAIATAEDFDSTKWTAITIGGELKSHDTRINTLDGIRQDNAGFHNSIYRGKFLGTSITVEQYAQISAGTFDDMFIGDYWTISTTFGSTTKNVDYVIAGFDYWWGVGDSYPQGSNKHHIVLVPREVIYNARMNAGSSTSGYVGSEMYTTNLANARTGIANAFSGHLYSVRKLFTKSIDANGKANDWEWVTSTVDLLSECMVYGKGIWSTSALETAFDSQMLPLFALAPSLLNYGSGYWLRTVFNANSFTVVYYQGYSYYFGSSNYGGVRPCFAIYGGD